MKLEKRKERKMKEFLKKEETRIAIVLKKKSEQTFKREMDKTQKKLIKKFKFIPSDFDLIKSRIFS